jgi:hypothetical protein
VARSLLWSFFDPGPRVLRRHPAPLRQRHPDEQGAGRDDDGEPDLVHGGPAEIGEDLAGRKRSDRHRAEHQEVVDRLDLVALVRATALGNRGGGAVEFGGRPGSISFR